MKTCHYKQQGLTYVFKLGQCDIDTEMTLHLFITGNLEIVEPEDDLFGVRTGDCNLVIYVGAYCFSIFVVVVIVLGFLYCTYFEYLDTHTYDCLYH